MTITRFKSDEQDLTIDWSSVEAIQKFRLNIHIYLISYQKNMNL